MPMSLVSSYQPLVSSVLHKYISGGLKDITADKAERIG